MKTITPRFLASKASLCCFRAAATLAADFLITAEYGFNFIKALMLVRGLRFTDARRTIFLLIQDMQLNYMSTSLKTVVESIMNSDYLHNHSVS